MAAGYGGRTIASCDDGKTWIANHYFMNDNDDHSPFTDKGLVFGNGRFVFIMGWGAESSVKVSDDGVNWNRYMLGGRYSGIGFGGDKFMVLGGNRCKQSSDGETWEDCPDEPSNGGRAAGGGGPAPGIFAVGAGGNLSVTWNGGRTWTEPNCGDAANFGNLGQRGGFAWINDTFVIVGDGGATCRSTDGSNWMRGDIGGEVLGKANLTGGRIWVASGETLYHGMDGVEWTTIQPQLGDVERGIHSISCSDDTGTCIGVEGIRQNPTNRFFRSTDQGQTWTSQIGPAGNGTVRRTAFGWVKASDACPTP